MKPKPTNKLAAHYREWAAANPFDAAVRIHRSRIVKRHKDASFHCSITGAGRVSFSRQPSRPRKSSYRPAADLIEPEIDRTGKRVVNRCQRCDYFIGESGSGETVVVYDGLCKRCE